MFLTVKARDLFDSKRCQQSRLFMKKSTSPYVWNPECLTMYIVNAKFLTNNVIKIDMYFCFFFEALSGISFCFFPSLFYLLEVYVTFKIVIDSKLKKNYYYYFF
jgi:hypothetical protein